MRIPDIRLWRMTAAMAASALGITIMKIALPTVAGVRGLSAAEIGLIAGAASIAWPVFGLAAGWGLDRFGRFFAFRLGLAFASVAALALALMFDAGEPVVLLLCSFALLIGVSEVLTETSGQTILPDLVGKSDLHKGNSLLQGGKTVAATLLAPLLLATALDFQPARSFGFALALMLASVALLPRPIRHFKPSKTGFEGFFDGAVILAREANHRRFTLLLTGMSLSWGAWMTLIVPYTLSNEYLGLGASGVGHIMTALGCGSLIGAFGYRRIRAFFAERGTLAIDPLATTVFLAVPAMGLGVLPVLLSALVAGLGGVTWVISIAAWQQASVPAVILGRVVSAYRWMGWSGFFAGAGLSGLFADAIGLQMAFLLFTIPAIAVLLYYWLGDVAGSAIGSIEKEVA